MDAGEWIALAALASALLGLIGRGVWLVAQMNTKMGTMIPQVDETHKAVMEHSITCDSERQVMEQRITGAEDRVARLEQA
jgi:hypothetical protein